MWLHTKIDIGRFACLVSDTSFRLMLWSGAQLGRVGIRMWKYSKKSEHSERSTSLRCICNYTKPCHPLSLSPLCYSVNPYNKHCCSPLATNIHPSMFDSTQTRLTDVSLDVAGLQVFSISLTITLPLVGVQDSSDDRDGGYHLGTPGKITKCVYRHPALSFYMRYSMNKLW